MATMPERLAALEAKQNAHEEENSQILESLSVRVDKAHALAQEAKDLAVQTNNSVENMPSKIIEAINTKNKSKRLEFKDWIIFIIAIVTVVSTLLKH